MFIRPHTKIPESATFHLATHANVEKSIRKSEKKSAIYRAAEKNGKKHVYQPSQKMSESATDWPHIQMFRKA